MSGSKVRIPLGDMARAHVADIFPQLTPAQIAALQAGAPLPTVGEEIEALRVALKAALDAAAHKQLVIDQVERDGPLVTCILTLTGDAFRGTARHAVNQFVAQTYPRKQLVVVNATTRPLITVEHPDVVEVFQGDYTAAAVAKTVTRGEYVCPEWGPDAWYHPQFLSTIHAGLRPLTGAALTHEIEVGLDDAAAYVRDNDTGLRRHALIPAAWVNETGGYHLQHRTLVPVVNAGYPGTALVTRFLRSGATGRPPGKWALTVDEAAHVTAVLGRYDVKITATRPTA